MARKRRGTIPDWMRFWKFVHVSSCRFYDGTGCWEWFGTTSKGYGRFWSNDSGSQVQAHRWAYERLIVAIHPGLQLDHLCRNRKCVNPLHVEPVTNRVNSLRGESKHAKNARKTHCLRGHPLSGENLRIKKGMRVCRTCVRDKNREYARARARLKKGLL